jgi:hypothetical protein
MVRAGTASGLDRLEVTPYSGIATLVVVSAGVCSASYTMAQTAAAPHRTGRREARSEPRAGADARLRMPSDAANQALFLGAHYGGDISGAVIPCDGGGAIDSVKASLEGSGGG